MKCAELIRILEQLAPESCACDWDNVGLLVGRREKEIKTVYIALDATDETIQEAVAAGVDLLLTHHPLIFRGIKRVTTDDFTGRRIIALIQSDIVCYAMHTNFDIMCMADLAAEKMGISGALPLEVTCEADGIPEGIGAVGNLTEEITLDTCCEQVKKAFDLEHVMVYGDPGHRIKRVAVCPGAGKSDVEEALRAGADVYITGDTDHHTGIDANARGMAIIDAGHYGMEHIFIRYMQQYLKEQAPQIRAVAQERRNPLRIV